MRVPPFDGRLSLACKAHQYIGAHPVRANAQSARRTVLSNASFHEKEDTQSHDLRWRFHLQIMYWQTKGFVVL